MEQSFFDIARGIKLLESVFDYSLDILGMVSNELNSIV